VAIPCVAALIQLSICTAAAAQRYGGVLRTILSARQWLDRR